MRNGAWVIGSSLALVVIALAMHFAFGDRMWGQALLYAAFPMSLLIAAVAERPERRGVLSLVGLVLALVVMYAAMLGIMMLAEAF